MAGRTITQRIALDGGAQIKSDLESIGKAAQAAFEKFNAVTSANNFLGRFGTSVDAVSAKVKALQVAGGNFGGAFGGFTSSISGVIAKLGILGSVSIAGAVTGFIALIKSAGEAQEALQNTADTLGIAAEKLEALQNAAEVSGIGGDQLTRALTKQVSAMNTAISSNTGYNKSLDALKQKLHDGKIGYQDYLAEMAKLNRNVDTTSYVFEKLGVSISDDGKKLRDPLAVFHDLADAFKDLPNGSDKAALALQIFGTRNSKVVSFLNAGADGLRKMTLEAERLAPALDKNGRAALDRASDAFLTLGKATEATKNEILAVFAPDVSALVEAYTNVVANSRAAWVGYAKTLESQVKPVVQDVIAVIEGRDQDVKNSFVLQARDAVLDFAKAVQNAVTNIIIPAFKELLKTLDLVAAGINSVFGTQLTGGQLAVVLVVTKLLGLFGTLASAVRLVASVIGLLAAAFGGATVAAVAVAAAVGFLIVKLALNLGSIGDVADRVFRGIPILAQGAVNLIVAAFAALGGALVGVFNGIVSLVSGAISTIGNALAAVPALVGSLFTKVGEIATEAWTAVASGAAALAEAIVTSISNAVQGVVAFFTQLPETLVAIFTAIVAMIGSAWDSIKKAASDVVDSVVGFFTDGVKTITGLFSGLATTARNILSSIMQGVQAVANAIAGAANGGGGDNGPAMATGGPVRGPGNGTSDSIRAWLSNGEFVQRTAAVRKYGLAFMNALNQGRISASRIRDLMQGADLSGLAAVTPNRVTFATGGLATATGGGSAGQPVNIHLGGKSFPLQGTPDVIRDLSLYASGKNARSGGRKPTWFGGGK